MLIISHYISYTVIQAKIYFSLSNFVFLEYYISSSNISWIYRTQNFAISSVLMEDNNMFNNWSYILSSSVAQRI